jgi:hypothetical protein
MTDEHHTAGRVLEETALPPQVDHAVADTRLVEEIARARRIGLDLSP